MIEGGWSFIWAAYAVALCALTALSAAALVRLRHWARRARDLKEKDV
ncbi:MAG: hypothetical protein R3C25_09120 [Hyphomonadaceae bacterium]